MLHSGVTTRAQQCPPDPRGSALQVAVKAAKLAFGGTSLVEKPRYCLWARGRMFSCVCKGGSKKPKSYRSLSRKCIQQKLQSWLQMCTVAGVVEVLPLFLSARALLKCRVCFHLEAQQAPVFQAGKHFHFRATACQKHST